MYLDCDAKWKGKEQNDQDEGEKHQTVATTADVSITLHFCNSQKNLSLHIVYNRVRAPDKGSLSIKVHWILLKYALNYKIGGIHMN